MKRTGVVATEEELLRIKELNAKTKLAGFTAAKLGPQRANNAQEKMQQEIHRCALEHGLPDTEGYYGIDMSNGEFVTFA